MPYSDTFFTPITFSGTEPFSSVMFGRMGAIEEQDPQVTDVEPSPSTGTAAPSLSPSSSEDWISDEIFWDMTEENEIISMMNWLEMVLEPGNVPTDYSEYWAVRAGGSCNNAGISHVSSPIDGYIGGRLY